MKTITALALIGLFLVGCDDATEGQYMHMQQMVVEVPEFKANIKAKAGEDGVITADEYIDLRTEFDNMKRDRVKKKLFQEAEITEKK